MVRLTDRPDMTLNVHRGRKTTMQQQNPLLRFFSVVISVSPHVCFILVLILISVFLR